MQTLTAQRRWISTETQRVALRFIWKELRMLRGLAVGVVGLAVVETAVLRLFLKAPEWMLISAFGATALFAVAATVTLFAVEREVGTTMLLELLPQNRAALFAGKVLAAAAMTLGVLGVLAALTALVCATDQWPDAKDASVIVSQGLVATFEALSYGLLMSLICPQPLLAAVLAIAAASLNSQLAMALWVPNARGFTMRDFQEAVPMRLALAAVVGAADVWLGLHWLQSLSRPRRPIRAEATAKTQSKLRPRKTGMLGRLMWQSVRQSWKTMLAATAVGVALMFAVDLIFQAPPLISLPALLIYGSYRPVSLLFVPALYGALAFRADQRRGQYRFLAEHAGRPRMVWLARQVTWLAPTIAWCLFVHVGAWLVGVNQFFGELRRVSMGNYAYGIFTDGYLSTAVQLSIEQESARWLSTTWTFWMASLAAYALGQLLSLALRSDVFAGLLSLGGSVLLLAWSYVAFVWQLPALWFIGPLAVGFFAASWLRVPDWLVDRCGMRRWAWPALAVILPVAIMLDCVPIERAAQVRYNDSLGGANQANATRSAIETAATCARELQVAGKEAADEYFRLSEQCKSPEFVPTDQFDDQLVELSRRDCRLPTDVDRMHDRVLEIQLYALTRARKTQTTDLERALELQLAARRMEAQRLSGEGPRSPEFWSDLESLFPEALLNWATTPGQTPEFLKRAIAELGEIDRMWPTPSGAVMNDYLTAQSVIRGQLPPRFLRNSNNKYHSQSQWLPYLANRLPGEQSRAERALDILAACALNYFAGLESAIIDLDHSPNQQQASELRHRLVSRYYDEIVATAVSEHWGIRADNQLWERARLVDAAGTSCLAADEFVSLGYLPQMAFDWTAHLALRRAERVRLALLAYRLERGSYPEKLQQLTPDYLAASEISDPYAAGPFGYQPEGFDKWTLGPEHDDAQKWYPPQTPLLWSVGTGDATPTERLMKYAVSESGERVSPDEQSRDDDEFIAEFSAEPAMVLDRGDRNWSGGEFWLPLPKP